MYMRGSNCIALNRKILVFWIGGIKGRCSPTMYERWPHTLV